MTLAHCSVYSGVGTDALQEDLGLGVWGRSKHHSKSIVFREQSRHDFKLMLHLEGSNAATFKCHTSVPDQLCSALKQSDGVGPHCLGASLSHLVLRMFASAF